MALPPRCWGMLKKSIQIHPWDSFCRAQRCSTGDARDNAVLHKADMPRGPIHPYQGTKACKPIPMNMDIGTAVLYKYSSHHLGYVKKRTSACVAASSTGLLQDPIFKTHSPAWTAWPSGLYLVVVGATTILVVVEAAKVCSLPTQPSTPDRKHPTVSQALVKPYLGGSRGGGGSTFPFIPYICELLLQITSMKFPILIRTLPLKSHHTFAAVGRVEW